jgi:hypothetical protein
MKDPGKQKRDHEGPSTVNRQKERNPIFYGIRIVPMSKQFDHAHGNKQ